ncbi:MAG: AAA family ATPase [Pirellulaceae bacterium]|nr:AAA family ATPase [Pirellulaceae bacterium]
MKIKDIQIDGFGVWSGLSVDSLPDGMTVFYGPNEAGKTTLMQFLRTMFYGFTPERRQRYLPPVFGGKPGGAMRVTGPGGGYEITRRTQIDDPSLIGQVAVTSSDGVTQGQHRLTTLLGSIDESIFTNVFAIGLRELQELSTLDDTTAADELYKLSSGLDRVSLVDVMRQLRAARNQIAGPTPEAGQIQAILLRREKFRDELEQLTNRGRRWSELAALQKSQRDEIGDLQQRGEQAALESKIVETAIQVRQPWLERDRLRIAVRDLAARTDLPDDARERLKRLQTALDEKKLSLQEIKKQRRELREKSRGLPLRKGILGLSSKIEVAAEQGPWIGSLQKQILQLESQVSNTTEQLLEDAKRLGLNDEDQQLLLNDKRLASIPDLSGQAISQLAGPAREVRIQTTRLKQAKERAGIDKKEVDRLAEQIDEFLVIRQQTDLHQAIAKQNDLIGSLRQQEQLEERLEKLIKHRKELDGEAVELASQEALPIQQASFQHLLFIAGGSSFLFGLARILNIAFYGTQSSGVLYSFFGIVAIIFGYLMRQFDERGINGDLNDCESQLDALVHQIRKTEAERDEMLKQLPEQGGSLEQRLKEAEYELSQMEALLPTAHNHQAALQRYQSARKQGHTASEALKTARSQWKRTLNQMGLAESLSPKSLRIMAEGYESLVTSRRRLKTQQSELDQRRLEMTTLLQRIEGLARQINVAKETDDETDAARGLRRDKRRDDDSITGRDDRSRDARRSEHRSEQRSNDPRLNLVRTATSNSSSGSTNGVADSVSVDGPVVKLQELTGLLAQQRQYITQRKQLRSDDEELSRKQKTIQRTIDKIIRSRQALLAELAVESSSQLDQLWDTKQKHLQLLAQVEEQEHRIRAILGGSVGYEAVQRQLESPNAGAELEKRWDAVEQRIQQTKERISQLQQRQGETAQEMKTLAADRRLAEVKLELATIDKQLELSAEHWRTLAVTSNLLEKVCEIYETERQPETLREASAFLKQLTDGKYTRVWTPLGKNALQIDNEKQQSLPLDVLSRGTREAVFIALRLSLAAAYARRGVTLPLVLDDVLVNFDIARAHSAARVLRDFSALGHQSIMFTCHEHIMRMFYDIGVQVRILPPHGQSGDAEIYIPETRVAISPPVFSAPLQTTVETVKEIHEPAVETPPEMPVAVAQAPVQPIVYETRFERVVEPEETEEVEESEKEVPRPRSQRKHRRIAEIKKEPAIDYAWYEYEPDSNTDDSFIDTGLLPELASSPPWTWDDEPFVEEALPSIINSIRDSAVPIETAATDRGDPWWRKSNDPINPLG